MSDKLLPCLVCKANQYAYTVPFGGLGQQLACECNVCVASSGGYETTEQAEKAWNTLVSGGAETDMGNPVSENVPLTLDELRGMDGEPMWIACGSFWVLVHTYGTPDVVLIENSGEVVKAEGWMKRMGNIYGHKPEEVRGMNRKRWTEENGKHHLHLQMEHDIVETTTLFRNQDGGWAFEITLFHLAEDFSDQQDAPAMKADIEEMVDKYLAAEIAFYDQLREMLREDD